MITAWQHDRDTTLALATHEAGHAINARWSRHVIALKLVSLTQATTVVQFDPPNGWDRSSWLLNRAQIALGGLAGESVMNFESRHQSLTESDLMDARMAAEEFLYQPSRFCLEYEWRRLPALPPSVHDARLNCSNEQTAAFLRHAWRLAQQAIADHRDDFQRLIGALIVTPELTQEKLLLLLPYSRTATST